MHIAIEGLDGVGKTTVAKELAKRLNYKFVEKPLHYLFDSVEDDKYTNYMRIIDQVNSIEDDTFKAWFYGLGNIYLEKIYGSLNIVTDRHLVSNYFWNGNETNYKMFEILIGIVGKPTYTFLLYATPEKRHERLLSRDLNDPDLKEVYQFDHNSYVKMENFLEGYNFNYKQIDTSNLNMDQVADNIEFVLKTNNWGQGIEKL